MPSPLFHNCWPPCPNPVLTVLPPPYLILLVSSHLIYIIIIFYCPPFPKPVSPTLPSALHCLTYPKPIISASHSSLFVLLVPSPVLLPLPNLVSSLSPINLLSFSSPPYLVQYVFMCIILTHDTIMIIKFFYWNFILKSYSDIIFCTNLLGFIFHMYYSAVTHVTFCFKLQIIYWSPSLPALIPWPFHSLLHFFWDWKHFFSNLLLYYYIYVF